MASPKKKWLAMKALENAKPAIETEPAVQAPKVVKAAPAAAKKIKKPVKWVSTR